MLEYHRYREAARHLHERLAEEQGYRYRSAPLPPALRRVSIEVAEAAYDPERLAEAIGELLRVPAAAGPAPRAPAARCRSSSACATCATCSAAGRASPSTRRWRAPTA